jgi:hypothetical protein
MSLTTTSRNFKRGMKLLVLVAFIYYLMILFVFPKAKQIADSLNENKDPPVPTYGQMDPLKFTKKPLNDPQPKYTLNTKNGKLPTDFPKKLPVYKFLSPKYSYLAGTQAQEDAKFLGFTSRDLVTDLKGHIYRWRSLESGGILEINTDTRKLTLETNIYGKSMEFKSGSIDTEQGKNIANNVFTAIGRLDDPLYKSGQRVVHLATFSGNNLLETTLGKVAQLARVDFYRTIGRYPILGPDPEIGLMYIVLRNPTKGESPFNYVNVSVDYHTIDANVKATYPIVTIENAWQQVALGNGIVVKVRPKNGNYFAPYTKTRVENALIDKVSLAYYETPEDQTYLQPIYVFEGKYTTKGTEGGDITIYYPAVTGDYIKGATPTKK